MTTVQIRTVLGQLQLIDVAYPMQLRQSDLEKGVDCSASGLTRQVKESATISPDFWDPPTDLQHVTQMQQETVREMLREECVSFAKDESNT